jgi:hypothetical protein
LGQYHVRGGWFNAVQIQGLAWGDTNAADWGEFQTATETGSYTARTTAGLVTVPININNVEDAPSPGAIFKGMGGMGLLNVDWLDSPGQGSSVTLPVKGHGQVVSGILTFSFTSGLSDPTMKQSCQTTWTFTLKF